MQSSTILLIALFTRVKPIMADATILLKKVKKATRWPERDVRQRALFAASLAYLYGSSLAPRL